MTTDQHIDKLEKDISEVKEEVSEVKDSLNELIELVKEMNKGLYGDAKNNHIGVITRQILQEEEIKALKQEIEKIKKINADQDIAIGAKNTYKDWLIKYGYWIATGIAYIIILIGILKDVVDKDALLK